jgi:sugar O-acyltransferase (sialic acid O-acetyltransferase NeuD family)
MSMRVMIVGAGALGQAAADILLRTRKSTEAIEPIGFVDDDPSLLGWRYLGLPVLGGVSALAHIPHDEVLIAVRENAKRCHLYEKIARGGGKFTIARHPSSVAAPGVVVGQGTIVCAGAAIGHGVVIGVDSVIGSDSCVAHQSRVGNHVYLGSSVRLDGNAVVGEGAIIGADVTVLARRRIGAWSVVDAGSVVERDVPDGSVAGGVPARPAGSEVRVRRSADFRKSDRTCCLRPIG